LLVVLRLGLVLQLAGLWHMSFPALTAPLAKMGPNNSFKPNATSGVGLILALGPYRQFMELTDKNNDEWLAYWASRYAYPTPHLYERNIDNPLTPQSVVELFTWKNGTPMSVAKAASVNANYVSAIGLTPPFATVSDGANYVSGLSGGAIWGIFWLHCLDSGLFPIFDQHTYRAMRVICSGTVVELPAYNPSKLRVYFAEYLPFLRRFASSDSRLVDKALFAYGKSKKVRGPRSVRA
jgi:hypothetical protein